MAHEVFLSYSADDRATALAVLAGLEKQGIHCWIAPRDIPAGSEYGEQIVEAIKACRLLVLIFSSSANGSPHVRREIERAVSAEKPVIPFRIENVVPTGGMECALGNTHWLDALAAPLEPHVATLVAVVKRLSGPRVAFGPAEPAAPAAAERPSVVVLPFNNMSGDPEQEYFSDGITEDIITDLSRISGLFVIARNTAFTYKGRAVKVQDVSRELGVTFVLEGSVRKAGSRVRVTGQLINGKDGGHVWADRYDRDLTDIFAIQDEITHAIVEQLKVKLLPQEKRSIAQAPTDNIEAYTCYLRGRQFLHYHVDVAIDSILATSAQALALDAGLAEAHASRGLALSLAQKYDEAMAEFERAMALDSNLFEAHYFCARACFAQHMLERAAQLFERAAELKPDDYQSLILLIQIYRSLGRDRDIEAVARRGVERAERELTQHPENPRPAYMGANALLALGDEDRAKEWLSRAMAIDLLERLLPHANHETKSWIRYDSDFDGLRSHPRYEKVLALIQ